MTAQPKGTPPALAHNLRYNKVLHEHVVTLMITTARVPHVPPEQQIEVTQLGLGFFDVRVRYGFMEDPNVPEVLVRACDKGLQTGRGRCDLFPRPRNADRHQAGGNGNLA